MASIKHNFQSSKPNSNDGTLVSSTAWNDNHVISGGTDKAVLFDDAGVLGEDSQITWDKVNKILLIGDDTTQNAVAAIKPILHNNTVGTSQTALQVQTDADGTTGTGTPTPSMIGVLVSPNFGGSGVLTSSRGISVAALSNYGVGTILESIGLFVSSQGVNGANSSVGVDIGTQNAFGAASQTIALHIDDQTTNVGVLAIKVDGGVNDLGPNNTAVGQLQVTAPSVPATSTSAGAAGTIAWDANFIYVCVATNSWKRVGISSW